MPEIECDHCGTEFHIKPYKLIEHEHHFCSVECKYDYWRENLTESQEEMLALIKNSTAPVTVSYLVDILGYARNTVREALLKMENLDLIDWTWINSITKGYFSK